MRTIPGRKRGRKVNTEQTDLHPNEKERRSVNQTSESKKKTSSAKNLSTDQSANLSLKSTAAVLEEGTGESKLQDVVNAVQVTGNFKTSILFSLCCQQLQTRFNVIG